jgi:quinol monooxygenase YgiN
MIQLMVRMLARPNGGPQLVTALRSVMRPAQQGHGCCFAQIYRPVNDDSRIEYIEEWDDPKELREEFASSRFLRLLEVLETAAEQPVVEFRIIAKIHGLEYIAAEFPSSQSSDDQQHEQAAGSPKELC